MAAETEAAISVTGDGAQAEADLIRRLQAGDGAAYEHVVRAHAGPMLAVIRRLLRNAEDAEEALQDAFVSAVKGIGEFRGGSRLSTWLHRIAVNAALMKLRHKKRRPETAIESLLPAFAEDGHRIVADRGWSRVPAEGPSDDQKRMVREAIDALPEGYRTVLILRDVQDYDTASVAEMLGGTPNSIKIRLHRARLALRTELERRFGEAVA